MTNSLIPQPRLAILGTRGVPARHGGFETFAEHLSVDLTERGWAVTVYCQEEGIGPITETTWHRVRRVHIPVATAGALGTMIFDWRAVRHVSADGTPCLVLGYNTAVFNLELRRKRLPVILNLDGIESRRQKWSWGARLWLRINEYAALRWSDHLIADHPEIASHFGVASQPERATVIPYESPSLEGVDPDSIRQAFLLEPKSYALIIARAEPENSILEMVTAWSAQPRGCRLVVLGNYDQRNPYHRAVSAAAGPEVQFLGAIYDRDLVAALRCHTRLYLHGHQVGGTNPSLVESLAAGNAVVAHDNPFNCWVAGPKARFFSDTGHLSKILDTLLPDSDALAAMCAGSRSRYLESFTPELVLGAYATLLLGWQPEVSRCGDGGPESEPDWYGDQRRHLRDRGSARRNRNLNSD